MRLARLLLAGALLAMGGVHAQENQGSEDFLSTLAWEVGPTTVAVPEGGVFQVPEGFVFLAEDDSARFQEYIQNIPSPGETMFAPDTLEWFAIFRFEETGYVQDDEAIDADAVLQTVRDGQEAANAELADRGWGTLTIDGWETPPQYDSASNRLEWAIRATSSDGGKVVNFNTRVLGRHGVMEVVLVTSPEALALHTPQFKTALDGFAYEQSASYAAYEPGDRVAEYGLAALIAGGAAAVVAKSGAGKALLKLVIGGLAALGALFAGIFRKKKKEPQSDSA